MDSDKERIFRKTVTHEMIERPSQLSKQTAFTTSPKTRRHIRHSVSGKRAKDFMEHLWRVGFNRCKYKALAIQFIQFFGTNDERTMTKYLGRPEKTVRHDGNATLRIKRGGGHALFSYSNTRKVKPKTGLMETLGYITLNKKTSWVKIHHEQMSYCTEQRKLEEFPPATPLSRSNECKSIIKDYCVRPIGQGVNASSFAGSLERERKKEEEDIIEHTNKFVQPVDKLSMPVYSFGDKKQEKSLKRPKK